MGLPHCFNKFSASAKANRTKVFKTKHSNHPEYPSPTQTKLRIGGPAN